MVTSFEEIVFPHIFRPKPTYSSEKYKGRREWVLRIRIQKKKKKKITYFSRWINEKIQEIITRSDALNARFLCGLNLSLRTFDNFIQQSAFCQKNIMFPSDLMCPNDPPLGGLPWCRAIFPVGNIAFLGLTCEWYLQQIFWR